MRPCFIKRLLFSGGGIRGVAYVGFLKELEKQKVLDGIREFCGVSAGAFMSFLLAIGYSIETIYKLCIEFDFTILPSLEPESLLLFFEEFGVDDGENVERLLRSLLKHKGLPQTLTFKELSEIPGMKGLRVWATDIENLELLEFSAQKTPNIDICIALKASMAYPIYFRPVKHPETGCLLVDGGVLDNYPIQYLTEKEIKETLGTVFVYKNKYHPIVGISDIFNRVITGLCILSHQQTLDLYKNNTVMIPCLEFSNIHIRATTEERQQIMDVAQEATCDFFKYKPEVVLKRRHSVG